MRHRIVGAVAGLALVAVLTPERAEAQESGWWEWALREVVETADRADRSTPFPGRDRERTRDGESSRTLGDILLGRDRTRDRDDDRPRSRRDDDRDDDRWESDDDDRRRGEGPAFCRSGAGHPVHGREWCRDKGWGLGNDRDDRSPVRWEDRTWEDVILRAPRDRDRRSGTVDRGGLIDILGDVVFGRLVQENRRIGGTEPLTGRWIRPGGVADVLQVRSGGVPVAELSDLDGDGRVDAVLVPRR